MAKRIIIAIDGYSACGKSTLAKDLAKKLNYTFIDSGAMYRGSTLYFIRKGFAHIDGINQEQIIKSLDQFELSFQRVDGKNCLFLNNLNVEDEIRQPHVADLVSQVSSIKELRQKLVAIQRKIGKDGGIVMDGRDIGSVVFPNADLKLFVTASEEIRAQRRFDELKNNGTSISLESVKENLNKRDYQDTHRKESPLIQVKDAIVVDNSNLSREEQLEWVLEKVNKLL